MKKNLTSVTNNGNEKESPIKNMKTLLYNENFKMSEQTLSKKEVCKVRNYLATFNIIAGPLLFNGKALQDTFVLEIHYKDSEIAHASTLPLGGFNSQLFYNYGEKAHELALKFIEEQGWILNTHLNSWPEFQAIVSKNESKKVIDDARGSIDNIIGK